MRRMGRPGLVGTMARTAVIAGTATAVSGGMQSRQQNKAAAQQQEYQQQQDIAYLQGQQAAMAAQAAAAPAAPAAPAEDPLMAELTKLGQMKAAGLIDDNEYAAAKAKLLGI